MTSHRLRRTGTCAVVALALSAGLAACGEDGDAAGDNPSAPSDAGTEGGDTVASRTFGEGCSKIPLDGAGSFEGMVEQTAGIAAGRNPVLKRLAKAVGAAGLAETLNDPDASYTIFAPADEAFADVPKPTMAGLIKQARGATSSPLRQILLHHVLTKAEDPSQVVGEQGTANGDTLTVDGDENGMTVSDGDGTATVLCGNIQTANATIYVIDQVLTGADLESR